MSTLATTEAPIPCSVNDTLFPFHFYSPEGFEVNGTLNEDGFCIFPQANCGLETSVPSCCEPKDEFTGTGSMYMFIAFGIIFLPMFYLQSLPRPPDDPDAQQRKKKVPSWVEQLPLQRLVRTLFGMGLAAFIAAQVMIPIFMRSSIQENLSVGNRNNLIAAEAFFIPYREIFQFIEDIVLIRVNYALGSGDKALTNRLVHAGVSGAFSTGCLAALLATLLGAIPPSLSALTSPGLSNNQDNLYPGCSLIVDAGDSVLKYWLLESWSIPADQLGKVMSGFLLGALELETLGWMGTISIALVPLIWFTNVDESDDPLILLATAEFSASWMLPVLTILYIVSPLGRDLREHTGVTLRMSTLFRNLTSLWNANLFHGADDNNNNTMSVRNANNDDEANETRRSVEDDDDPQQEMVEVDCDESCESYQAQNVQATRNEESATTNSKDDMSREPYQSQIVQAATSNETANVNTKNDASLDDDEPGSTRTLLIEGFKIMFMDVAIQLCISLSVYLALLNDAADGYKLTALQSELPTYGIAYALGMGIMFKVVGPQLIAKSAFTIFVRYARITMVCAFLLVPLILGAVIPFRDELAFSSGRNACAYAKDSQCVPFFTNVFGPNGDVDDQDFTLAFTFNAFAMGASVEAVFYVLRAILLALVDLDYMLQCTVVAVLVYIPCVSVAATVPPFGGHAISFFVAMYVPQVVLVGLFAVRIESLLRRMLTENARAAWIGSNNRRGSLRRSAASIRIQSGAA